MRERLKRLRFSFTLTPRKVRKGFRKLRCWKRGYHDWPSDPELIREVGCLWCGTPARRKR